ncbi:hypothetical protein [Agrococcus casei]|uniref:hypothetical protein n=1 Tax=Agrococcus casei TaxID=343512 RepID=UPI003F8DB1EA
MPESLKLVENDQVGAKRLHSSFRERVPELGNRVLHRMPDVVWKLLRLSQVYPRDQRRESPECSGLVSYPPEGLLNLRVDSMFFEVSTKVCNVTITESTDVVDPTAKQSQDAHPIIRAGLQQSLEQQCDQCSLVAFALPHAAVGERRARRE